MSSGNKKLRVTVTVEEFDSPKSKEVASPNDISVSLRNLLKSRLINQGIEIFRRLFPWMF
jgi:hypothetical protein